MRLVLAFVALLLSLPLSPQARPKGYELDYYRVRLESVETDGARGGVIGNPENEQGFTTPGYRDSTIRVVFTFEPTHVDFSLTNESDSDFGIIWDEAVFVDGVSNAAEGVFHRGVKLLDRHDAQVPSVVVKGSCVSESLAVKNLPVLPVDGKHEQVVPTPSGGFDRQQYFYLRKLIRIPQEILEYPPFEVATVKNQVRAEFDTGRWFYVSEK